MTGRPPYFAFYPADFANDINVEAMSTLQVGAYLLLLCKAWQAEPPASLPSDDVVLARLSRVELAVWLEIKSGVLALFRPGTDGRLHNKRLRQEYDKARQLIETRKRVAASGAAARWKPDASSMPEASGKQCLGNAIQSQIKTQNQKTEEPPNPQGGTGVGSTPPQAETLTSKKRQRSKSPDGPPPEGFAEFWAAYPAKADKKAAVRAFTRLAPSPELLAVILAAVARQRAWPKWLKDGGQFVPNPATWLNGSRWEDLPPAPSAAPSRAYDSLD